MTFLAFQLVWASLKGLCTYSIHAMAYVGGSEKSMSYEFTTLCLCAHSAE